MDIQDSAFAPHSVLPTKEMPSWKVIFKIGGVCAFLFLAYSAITMISLVIFGGQPETVEETFRLLQSDRLVGLLRLDLLTVIVMPLYYLIFFALYGALKRDDDAFILLATVFVFVGLTLVLATPTAYSMISLSNKHALATTLAEKAQLLAAGEALIASDIWHNTGALMGGILLQCGIVLISVIMLQDRFFGKAIAYLGILAHGLDLLHMIVGFFSQQSGVILLAIGGTLYLAWFPLIGQRLLRLGSLGQETTNI